LEIILKSTYITALNHLVIFAEPYRFDGFDLYQF
jgi:hypothetical protein